MSVITAILGAFSTAAIDREGRLVDQTYDHSLMAVSFARAASADFYALLAASARMHRLGANAVPADAGGQLEKLRQTMEDDLFVAVERAQSPRALAAVERIKKAVSAWSLAETTFPKTGNTDEAWRELDRLADTVISDLDLLINYTAGDGFTYRQTARTTIKRSREINMLATAGALALSGLIAWLLARHIIGPIKNASHVASRIARGDLNVAVPTGHPDELGDLLASMEEMRRSIKQSMEREVGMRQSAQVQLANALEHSGDGVVVTDSNDLIVLANARAIDLLRTAAPNIDVGGDADALFTNLSATEGDGSVREFMSGDGRWLRVSQNRTQDGGGVIICSDISLIKSQQTALNTANFWLDAALANLSQGLCLFGADGQLKVYNRRFCSIFDLSIDGNYAGMRLDEVLRACFGKSSPDDQALFRSRLSAHLEATRSVEAILSLQEDRKIASVMRPLQRGGWLATFEDVTERLEAERKIAFMARHDALTGLPNRLFFAERVAYALSGVPRGKSFALLCLDLDHFKQINDTLGHPTGDELLREVALRIRSCLRAIDTFARLGGDEFAIVQTEIEDADDAAQLSKRILEVLEEPFQLGANKVGITASIGVSIAPGDGEDYDKLLKNADMALYRAKTDGRNTTRFFQPGMDEALQARRDLEMDLRDAVAEGQLEVHYQPIFSIAEPRFSGVEALLRWRHPKRGQISPAEFIPISEEIGLIGKIGDFVLATACADAMRWPGNLTVAVNVSAAQFRDGDLVHKVVQVLYDTGLPAARLELEITETALLEENRSTVVTLQHLRELGVKIALDDFGTGYSSLSYIRSFPFDRLKIDQGFTRDASPGSRAIIRTIINLCATLNMRTTAEGVETRDQLELLMREGCDEAQGFYFSRPVTADCIAAFIRQPIEDLSERDALAKRSRRPQLAS